MSIKISIVVPVYNMETSIEKCIISLMQQTYRNIEIIIVDDGSTDQTLSICNRLKEKDERILVIHTENRGSGPARNTGISHSTGKYICFPDADDIVASNAIEKLYEGTECGRNDLVIASYRLNNSLGYTKDVLYPDEVLAGIEVRNSFQCYTKGALNINTAPWFKLYDLEKIKFYKIDFPELKRHQDVVFVLKYLSIVRNIRFMSDILYIHEQNDIKKVWNKFPADYIDIVIALYQYMNSIIVPWNPKNMEVVEYINNIYITKVIRAIELSYSPQCTFSYSERFLWVVDVVKKANLESVFSLKGLRWYHSIVMRLICNGRIKIALLFIRIKTLVEIMGLIS